jgi:hypothetical protein
LALLQQGYIAAVLPYPLHRHWLIFLLLLVVQLVAAVVQLVVVVQVAEVLVDIELRSVHQAAVVVRNLN